jgi:hypothetical protein
MTFFGSMFCVLLLLSIVLTMIYYRCRMDMMKKRHISNQVVMGTQTAKAPLNDYQKKMSAARVIKLDYPVRPATVASVNIREDLTAHAYTYMGHVRNKI